MRNALRRIGRDLRHRRYLDVYVVSAFALVFAVLSVVGDLVSEDVRWAILLAGVGLLVYRIPLSEHGGAVDDLLSDRTEFDANPLPARLSAAKEVWLLAPSGANLLSAANCENLRRGPLGRADGSVRVVVLDPAQEHAVSLATRQLDDAVDFPIQQFRPSLDTTLRQLRTMSAWPLGSQLEYRLIEYNPGFSLVAFDPHARDGRIIVEFHGLHNETTTSRMHIELTRGNSERWYTYWLEQFNAAWQQAQPPHAASHDGNGPR